MLDPRITPARADLAATHLRGLVQAERFVDGVVCQVSEPVVNVSTAPVPDAPLQTQALYGERVTVYEEHEGWAFVQLETDAMVGYVPATGLMPLSIEPTHYICVPRSHLYVAATIKIPPVMGLPLGARVTVSGSDGQFYRIGSYFMISTHLAPITQNFPDYVAIAESFIAVPYLWGGKSSLGLDCSGLVQIALQAAGSPTPRDSDMQAEQIGVDIPLGGHLERGDLVFWGGHVGIMRNAHHMLHANGYHMQVVSEPLEEARARILVKTNKDIIRIKRIIR
jgi:hypothetical protein